MLPKEVVHRHSDCQSLRRLNAGHLTLNNAFRIDPTRTTALRARFVREMNKRFVRIKRDVKISIIDNDCFGIQPDVLRTFAALRTNSPIPSKAYEFKRSAEKVEAFMKWLEEMEALGILEIIRQPGRIGIEVPWTNVFIDSAYSKGMRRARLELQRKGYRIPSFEAIPGGIGMAFNRPFHVDRIGVIYSRTFEDLKSVTQVMNAQTRRLIADGLTTGLARGIAEGQNPKVIARALMKDVAHRVDKIGITRARMIARTEVIRAHHVATIAEYEQAEADMQVEVQAEWSTAGYDVCPICEDLARRGPYSLRQIEGMLPAHPNCRCCALPVVSGETRR